MAGKDFAIVGCGIAGPTVAFLLAEQGSRVTIFEQASELRPVGAGVMLQPLGQLVLSRIGMLASVIRDAEPIHELHAIQHSGSTMIRMPFSASRTGMHAYGVHRNDIFQALVSRTQSSGVKFSLGTTVASTRLRGERVEVLDTSGRVHGEFDHVIIASGSRTLLRSLTGFQAQAKLYNHGAIWFNASSPSIKGKLLQIVQGTDRLMGILPVGRDRVSLFWGVPCRDADACRSSPIDQWKDEVRSFYPQASEVLDSIDSWDQSSYGTYQNSIVNPQYDSHHLFLGDAAHAMSPHLGQGLNFALLDAYRFAMAWRYEQNWSDACRVYFSQQSSHLSYYRFITGLLAPYFQSDQAWRGVFRDWVLPWFHRTPLIRWQMALTMTGLKGGFFSGAMKLN